MESAIVVVDDNEDNRFTLWVRPEAYGYSDLMMMASNGREGARKAGRAAIQPRAARRHDAELDGYGVLEGMRADGKPSSMPVLVISAVDEIPSVVRCWS
jgi:hypothetical protein